MIQRKQTIFLLFAAIACMCCLSLPLASIEPQGMGLSSQLFNLGIVDGNGSRDFTTWPLFAVLLLSATLSFFDIFLYKNRRQQAALCTFSIFLLVVWYLIFAWYTLLGDDLKTGTLTMSITVALPAVAIILNVLARKGILADEKLVRSMDRIR